MKIGVFDSGYGGLTILEKIRERLPQYDYLYLGDNARAPYGTRSFEVIYEYTLQAVRWLENQGCRLIILACNTASAKALRTIQQHDINPDKLRVLGVIRPTVEAVPALTKTGHVGVLATPATVSSESYSLELAKENQALIVTQQACPMWVPLIEAGEHLSEGADYFVDKYLQAIFAKDSQIDTLILGCTHYPLLLGKIQQRLANDISTISQGTIVADSLADYLKRHSDIEADLSQGGTCRYITTESEKKFRDSASLFLSTPIVAEHIELQ
jgi:glutamate racemase